MFQVAFTDAPNISHKKMMALFHDITGAINSFEKKIGKALFKNIDSDSELGMILRQAQEGDVASEKQSQAIRYSSYDHMSNYDIEAGLFQTEREVKVLLKHQHQFLFPFKLKVVIEPFNFASYTIKKVRSQRNGVMAGINEEGCEEGVDEKEQAVLDRLPPEEAIEALEHYASRSLQSLLAYRDFLLSEIAEAEKSRRPCEIRTDIG
ncbi:hypothetical protein Dalk_2616 [Desulfatibacillum aliphaticivorans]|uniref:Uncharacterized protein n=1 Tax=Desulfatibacillum aliphaticivorans TaxID=218208 RepID=B8FIR8_DESAL|nr:hypothetical protein [Desulfatibacillum aliphaticivorans]ACL04309.1 hypothetical protein Dalk_2616 [Desulfatibacillum aliphaticivorans]